MAMCKGRQRVAGAFVGSVMAGKCDPVGCCASGDGCGIARLRVDWPCVLRVLGLRVDVARQCARGCGLIFKCAMGLRTVCSRPSSVVLIQRCKTMTHACMYVVVELNGGCLHQQNKTKQREKQRKTMPRGPGTPYCPGRLSGNPLWRARARRRLKHA